MTIKVNGWCVICCDWTTIVEKFGTFTRERCEKCGKVYAEVRNP